MIRYRDQEKAFELSVRDLVERARSGGDLSLSVVQSLSARAAAGRAAHTHWQRMRAGQDTAFAAEKKVSIQLEVDGWIIGLQGRVDGPTIEAGHTVVEELKSTTLPADRL